MGRSSLRSSSYRFALDYTPGCSTTLSAARLTPSAFAVLSAPLLLADLAPLVQHHWKPRTIPGPLAALASAAHAKTLHPLADPTHHLEAGEARGARRTVWLHVWADMATFLPMLPAQSLSKHRNPNRILIWDVASGLLPNPPSQPPPVHPPAAHQAANPERESPNRYISICVHMYIYDPCDYACIYDTTTGGMGVWANM